MAQWSKPRSLPAGLRTQLTLDRLTSRAVPLVIQSFPTPQPRTLAVHHVHTNLLVGTSAFFRRQPLPPAPWRSDEIGLVNFKIYVDWLYTGAVCSREEDPRLCEYARLARLYKLGVQLEDVTFQTAVADAFLEKVIEEVAKPAPTLPSSPCLQQAFWESATPNPIRRLVAEIYARHGSQEQVEALLTQMGFVPAAHNFLQAYGRALREVRMRNPGSVATLRGCQLHDHDADEQCPLQTHSRTQRRVNG
ncbi:hypothetical protein LTR78_002913 [Recurvomyces mirabilis]|uniref:BTB domain-containing protein n=1 Tax=Recurvomyces mirabilis TaxID=574656 RepID=A0AAE0WTB2_9PEZI|nr:hypothetical protein LTR78_002913 [Recurvomyces mirabilis]KAK5159353.1 hypothetical protein LTS14_002495 [Recurvomyces mirabilis]